MAFLEKIFIQFHGIVMISLYLNRLLLTGNFKLSLHVSNVFHIIIIRVYCPICADESPLVSQNNINYLIINFNFFENKFEPKIVFIFEINFFNTA